MTPSKSAQPLCLGLVYGVLFDTTTQPYVQPLCLRLVYGVLFACTTSTAVSSDADFALGILCFVRLIRQGLINGNLLAAGFEVFLLVDEVVPGAIERESCSCSRIVVSAVCKLNNEE